MVIGLMVILERFPGHVGDKGRVAAGLVADRRAGEGRAQHIEVGHRIEVHRAEHLGIDRALDRQIILHGRHAVAPGLLAVDALILEDAGMQAAVGIKIGVLQQLRLGEAGHGIGRHERIGHGVHEGIVGLEGEIEEQRGGGILVRAVQRRVLKDVGQARVVDGAGEEGQVEHAVGIAVRDVHELCAGALMLKQDRSPAHERELPQLTDDEALHRLPGRGEPGLRGQGSAQARHQKGKDQKDRESFFHNSLPPA